MPAHPRTVQAALARRARALAPGVDCLARQTDVMSVNPTCGPTFRISQLTDVLRCKLQECFQYRMHITPPRLKGDLNDRRCLERREVSDHLRTGRDDADLQDVGLPAGPDRRTGGDPGRPA